MQRELSFAGLVAGCLTLAGAAQAATVDFTDSTVWSDASSTQVVDLGSYLTTVSIAGVGGAPVFTPYDGPNPVTGMLGGSGLYVASNPELANDGAGITPGDEISNPDERLVVNFSRPIRVTGFHILDLFRAADETLEDREAAQIYVDDELVARFEFPGNEAFSSGGSGYFFSSVGPFTASRISFGAAFGNDLVADPDFALAGIDVAPVPLPAGLLLLGSGLAGFALFGRRKV